MNNRKLAKALIIEGKVRVENKAVDKPGALISAGADIDVNLDNSYVSRGGTKLEGCFKDFNLSAEDVDAADVGSSTGGFTDFLLRKGAKKVIAIDVGYGQLSWKLRQSPQVFVFERTNIRYLDIEKLPFYSDLTVVDVSFISIKKIFQKILDITKQGKKILLLVKPQFELKKEEVQEKGIITDSGLHGRVLKRMTIFFNRFPVTVEGITFSKIKGTKGNIEYWIYLTKSVKGKENIKYYDKMINDVVEKSHCFFNKRERG